MLTAKTVPMDVDDQSEHKAEIPPTSESEPDINLVVEGEEKDAMELDEEKATEETPKRITSYTLFRKGFVF